MKKMISVLAVTLVMLGAMLIPNEASARPWYLKVRIGFFAKWSVVLGDCKPGWGICLSFSTDAGGMNQLSYDDETNKLTVMIHKDDPLVRNIQNGYIEVKEDSQVDPKLIAQFPNFRMKDKELYVKAGKYRTLREGDYLVAALEFYLK